MKVQDAVQVQDAVRALDASGVVAVATETVYGLVCRLDRPGGIDRLFALKERSRDQPFQVLFASREVAFRYAALGSLGWKVCSRFMPGPFMAIGRAKRRLPDLGGAQGTIGFRVPAHPAVTRLAEACGPLVASSANRTGRPTPPTMDGVRAVFGDEIDSCIDLPPPPSGVASTIVDFTVSPHRILREGAVPRSAILDGLGDRLEGRIL